MYVTFVICNCPSIIYHIYNIQLDWPVSLPRVRRAGQGRAWQVNIYSSDLPQLLGNAGDLTKMSKTLSGKGGMGMKIRIRIAYRVSNKFQVQVHVNLHQKTLASQAMWSIDTKVLNIWQLQHQIFYGHRIFHHFYHIMLSFKSINIVFDIGKCRSWPNTLTFWVG